MAKFTTFVRGNWVADNSDDAMRSFNISAEVQVVAGGKVTAVINGQAKKGDVLVATFSQGGSSKLPTFSPLTEDAAEATSAYQAVIAFAEAVVSAAAFNPKFNE